MSIEAKTKLEKLMEERRSRSKVFGSEGKLEEQRQKRDNKKISLARFSWDKKDDVQ